jgi:hypothetical protein
METLHIDQYLDVCENCILTLELVWNIMSNCRKYTHVLFNLTFL